MFRFSKEITTPSGVPAYRFTPPEDVFSSVEENPYNECFCPHGPPCAPSGFFNVSLCQLGMHRHKIFSETEPIKLYCELDNQTWPIYRVLFDRDSFKIKKKHVKNTNMNQTNLN